MPQGKRRPRRPFSFSSTSPQSLLGHGQGSGPAPPEKDPVHDEARPPTPYPSTRVPVCTKVEFMVFTGTSFVLKPRYLSPGSRLSTLSAATLAHGPRPESAHPGLGPPHRAPRTTLGQDRRVKGHRLVDTSGPETDVVCVRSLYPRALVGQRVY